MRERLWIIIATHLLGIDARQIWRAYSSGCTISKWNATLIFSIHSGFKQFIITSVRPNSSHLPSLFFANTTTMGSLWNKIGKQNQLNDAKVNFEQCTIFSSLYIENKVL